MNEEIHTIKPSLLAAICFIQFLQVIVVLLMLAMAWNGGYWKGRDTGFTDMYNASHSMVIQPKTKNSIMNPTDGYGAKVPPGWEEVPTKNPQ